MTEFVRPDIDWAALARPSCSWGPAWVLLVGVFLPRPVRTAFGAFFAAAGFVAAGIVSGFLFDVDDSASTLVRDSLIRDRLETSRRSSLPAPASSPWASRSGRAAGRGTRGRSI